MKDFNEPKVSVIIPFYNNSEEAIRAIHSVLRQTYSNLEILLIDDGSVNRSQEIENFLKNNKNTIFIRNQINMGPGYSRNQGILNATGDYIAFLDSDDEWTSDKLIKQIKFMEFNNVKATHTSYKRLDNRTKKNKTIYSGKYDCKLPWSAFRCLVATPTVILKKEIALSSYFPEDIRYMEDTIYWLEVSKKMKFKGLNFLGCNVNVDQNTSAFNKNNLMKGMKLVRENYLSSNLMLKKLHFFYCKLRGI